MSELKEELKLATCLNCGAKLIAIGPSCKSADEGGIYAKDKNPLRTAMICFLKMKDAEHGR